MLASGGRGHPPDATGPQLERAPICTGANGIESGERTRCSRFEVVSSGVIGNRIYLEAIVEHADGTMVPNMNIMEVEEGQIRRARVYTDKVVHDGVGMDDFVRALNRQIP